MEFRVKIKGIQGDNRLGLCRGMAGLPFQKLSGRKQNLSIEQLSSNEKSQTTVHIYDILFVKSLIRSDNVWN